MPNVTRAVEAKASVAAGEKVLVADLKSCVVQVTGTFTATLKLEGSMDGTNFQQIGSDITAAGLTAISPVYNYIRLNTTAYTSGTPAASVAGKSDAPAVCRAMEAPASVAAGAAVKVSDLGSKTVQIWGTFTATLQLQASMDGVAWQTLGANITGADARTVADEWNFLRINTSAYTSGTPLAAVAAKPRSEAAYSAVEFGLTLFVPTPSAPTVAAQGATGATTYDYKIVGKDADGNVTAASSATQITDGNAALSATNFNRVTFTPHTNALGGHDIYRTAGGATQGKVGSVAAGVGQFDDTGLAASGSAPTANVTGQGAGADVSGLSDLKVLFEGTFVADLDIEGSVDGSTYKKIGSTVTAVGVASVTETVNKLRIKNGAFTSGLPKVVVVGKKS